MLGHDAGHEPIRALEVALPVVLQGVGEAEKEFELKADTGDWLPGNGPTVSGPKVTR
jgi:hypothetical protein